MKHFRRNISFEIFRNNVRGPIALGTFVNLSDVLKSVLEY